MLAHQRLALTPTDVSSIHVATHIQQYMHQLGRRMLGVSLLPSAYSSTSAILADARIESTPDTVLVQVLSARA